MTDAQKGHGHILFPSGDETTSPSLEGKGGRVI